MPRSAPTSLKWFPYEVEAWEQRCNGLSFDEETALHRAVRQAWNDKEVPCTLVDTPAAWARLLGGRHPRLVAFLRRHFTPDPAHPGRLCCAWLGELRAGQIAKYEVAAEMGQKAWEKPGQKRGPKQKPQGPRVSPANSPADSPANHGAIAHRRGGFAPGSYEPGGEDPPASDDAPLAPEGRVASPSATGHSNGNGVPDAPTGPRPDLVAMVRAAMPDVPRPLPESPSPVIDDAEVIARREAKRAQFAAWRTERGRDGGSDGGVATLDAEHPDAPP